MENRSVSEGQRSLWQKFLIKINTIQGRAWWRQCSVLKLLGIPLIGEVHCKVRGLPVAQPKHSDPVSDLQIRVIRGGDSSFEVGRESVIVGSEVGKGYHWGSTAVKEIWWDTRDDQGPIILLDVEVIHEEEEIWILVLRIWHFLRHVLRFWL